MKKIIRAEHAGMCFGVRQAIQLALNTAGREPLTILGELVHNETVLAQLRSRNIQMEDQLQRVATGLVMVTAHGASEAARQKAEGRGLRVLEATCPLVKLVQRTVADLVSQGFHPVIIGSRNHAEVRGMTEDLAQYDVLSAEAEVAAVAARPRFGVVAQTTQPIDKVRRIVAALREHFPDSEVRFIDTVCLPTKQRQAAAVELAQHSQVVVVIGGPHSNNTRELSATCRRHCPRVFQVQKPEDIQADWFGAGDTIGITAGTSTPDELIDAVEARVRDLASCPALAAAGA